MFTDLKIIDQDFFFHKSGIKKYWWAIHLMPLEKPYGFSFEQGEEAMMQWGSGHWEVLGGTGRDWEALGGTGRDWEGLGSTGRDWDVLGGTGRHWEALGGTRRDWEALRGTGRDWEILGGTGRHSEALGGGWIVSPISESPAGIS